uniref:pyridoxal 5'-phosphate synthase n=1 Tax=Glossina morsitans morsitans TaxID=37546 RepID=A0A1B0FR79_GLOMM
MNKMMNSSDICKIHDLPSNPIELFNTLTFNTKMAGAKYIPMNLATVDSEFGVLNRTVVYRGLTDDSGICFATEQNPKSALTMLLSIGLEDAKQETWQIRLMNACAVELDDQAILSKFWQEEPLFAKIRSHIVECGKPTNHEELVIKHNKLLADYQSGQHALERTPSYTVFKILPKIWDFYKSEPGKIADRVQYKLRDYELNEWTNYHVAA